MLTGTFRAAIHHNRLYPKKLLLFSSTTTAAAAADIRNLIPIFAQFLPPRDLQSQPLTLPPLLLHQLLISLSRLLKTQPQSHPDLLSLSLSLHPSPLSRQLLLLSSLSPSLSFAFLHLSLSPKSQSLIFSFDSLRLLSRHDRPLSRRLLSSLLGPTTTQILLLSWAHHPSSRPSTLDLSLHAFLHASLPSQSLQILTLLRRRNLLPTLPALSVLIRLLFRSGDPLSAWALFLDTIALGPRPSVRTFDAMILGFSLRGSLSKSRALLGLMSKFRLSPEASTFNILIKAQCVHGRTDEAFDLYDEMLQSGCCPSIVTYNILIDARCREGRMGKARELFDYVVEYEGLEHNTVTYNVLIHGYVKAGRIGEADAAYKEMRRKGLVPDCYTFNILSAGHSKFQRDKNGAFDSEAFPDDGLGVLVSRFCWEDQLDNARELLYWAVKHDKPLSVPAFNSVISGYSKKGLDKEAIEIYHVMVEAGLPPSAATCNYLLAGLCKGGRLDEAREEMDKMTGRGFYVNVSTFTIIIDGCFRVGDVDGAQRWWHEMETRDIYPDVIAYSAYINGLCQANYVEEACKILREMCREGLIPNNFAYNSLILGFCRMGSVGEALELKREMMQNGLVPDIFTINILIKGFCWQGRLGKATDMLKKMYEDGLMPDIVTYNTLIGACYRASNKTGAEILSKRMSLEDWKPDIYTYNIQIHSLCSSYKTNGAMQKLNQVILKGLVLNSATCNTMMNGICIDAMNGAMNRAMILTGMLLKLAFIPNVITVNLILSHFCKKGMAKSALMWEQRLNEVSSIFDDATRNILNWAHEYVQTEAVDFTSDSGLFLHFLLQITYDFLVRNRPPSCRQLVDSSDSDHVLPKSSMPMDVRW